MSRDTLKGYPTSYKNNQQESTRITEATSSPPMQSSYPSARAAGGSIVTAARATNALTVAACNAPCLCNDKEQVCDLRRCERDLKVKTDIAFVSHLLDDPKANEDLFEARVIIQGMKYNHQKQWQILEKQKKELQERQDALAIEPSNWVYSEDLLDKIVQLKEQRESAPEES